MKKSPEWVDISLRFAGIVNIVWGLIFALFTNPLFNWAKLPEPAFILPWQLLGIVAVILGLGYYIASFNIVKSSLLLMVGLAIKIAGTITVWKSVITHDFSLPLALYFSAKDALWVVPFGMVIYHIFKKWQAPGRAPLNPTVPFSETLTRFSTNQGHDLRTLARRQPVLLVFLPSASLSLFKKYVQDLSEQRAAIAQQRTHLVLVYTQQTEAVVRVLQQHKLASEEHILDEHHSVSNTFSLRRAGVKQVIGRPWQEGLGRMQAVKWRDFTDDDMRMPAAFLIYRDELLKSYYYEQVEDTPDYTQLATRDPL